MSEAPKVKRVLDYEGELIGAIPREENTETRVYVRESRKGGHYVEIRRWIHLERYDGPDKKGIGLHKDEVEGILELLVSALDRAIEVDKA